LNTHHIAFIGFGEVGQTFAEGLLAHGDVRVTAHDVLVARCDGETIRSRAAALGVVVHDTPAEAARGAAIIISAVTAHDAQQEPISAPDRFFSM
jgi:3-hydroxyisobutyrate dehydrogenase-like beta-hydroxyacid dehydrogenase